MPAKSKAQQKFMSGVAHGTIPAPKGLSKAEARDFARTPTKGLPKHASPKRTKRTKR